MGSPEPFNPDVLNGPTEPDEEDLLKELYGDPDENGLYFPENDASLLVDATLGTVSSVLTEAKRWIGTTGRPNVFTRWYANTQKHGSAFLNAPWCDIFVTYVARHSDTALVVLPGNKDYAYTVWHAQGFEKLNKWDVGDASGVSVAKPGWIVFFDWDSSNNIGKIDHVGFVEKNLGGGTLQTLEGNTRDSVRRRIRRTAHIVGFGMATYAPSKPTSPTKPTVPSASPYLRNGSRGTRVRQLQQCLLYLGYRLPKYGADSRFGDETETALRAFQKKSGASVDGVYGPETRAKLVVAVNNK